MSQMFEKKTLLEGIPETAGSDTKEFLNKLFPYINFPEPERETEEDYFSRLYSSGILTYDQAAFAYSLRNISFNLPPLPEEVLDQIFPVADSKEVAFMQNNFCLVGKFPVNSRFQYFVASSNPHKIQRLVTEYKNLVTRNVKGFITLRAIIERALSKILPRVTAEEGLAQKGEVRDRTAALQGEEEFNRIFEEAVKHGASDIHFSPEAEGVKVTFRISRWVLPYKILDPALYKRLLYFISERTNLGDHPYKTYSRRGKFITSSGEEIRYRLSALPTAFEYGHSLVIRIHRKASVFQLENLGLPEKYLNMIKRIVLERYGLVLVCGPTGSGKSTTIYSILRHISEEAPYKRIITLEDPAEVELRGIIQSEINEAQGYNFRKGLREVLRQDPDIIFVGEIRDEESATLVVQAAVTGHMVFSTIHANSVEDIPKRLAYLGVSPEMILASSRLFIEQWIVRLKEWKEDASNLGNGLKVLFSMVEFTEDLKKQLEGKDLINWKHVIASHKDLTIADQIEALYRQGMISFEEYREFGGFKTKKHGDRRNDSF